jgi:acetoin utilization deacetylase AcuC-like enzyme
MAVTLFTHPACGGYDLPAPYPDRARRLTAVADRLIAAGLDPLVVHRQAEAAGAAALGVVHSADYLAGLAAREPARGAAALDTDTLLVPGILAAARGAAGAALAGAEAVLAGRGSAFALTRPPGHHACRDRAGGFCLINHAALAALHARGQGIQRVAVVDFDAHHGDGSEALVAADAGVRLFSLYEAAGFHAPDPGAGPGDSLRLALPHGGDGGDLQAAVTGDLLPALTAFAPELLVVSAGFDGHREDDLSDLRLSEGDYAWLTQRLLTAVAPTAGRRGLFVLEGGYAPEALGRSVAAVVDTLVGA